MVHLSRLRQLEELHVWDASKLSDAGIERLRRLNRLKSVHLMRARIGDLSLQTLALLPNLEYLAVPMNRFTDDGLLQLAPLSHLKELWVGFYDDDGNERVPDHIAGLENLLDDPDAPPSAITKEGVERLKAMMPSLKHVYR